MIESTLGTEMAVTDMSLLESWVRINSFTQNIAGCNQMADALVASLASTSMRTTRYAGVGCGDHLAFVSPAWKPNTREGILLVGHHDTVFPPGSFEAAFPEVFGKVTTDVGLCLRGPGVLDMKGGLWLVVLALHQLHSEGLLEKVPLAFVSVGDEETGSKHSRTMLAEVALGARYGLVFESGRAKDAIVTRRRGTGKLSIAARGRAAHAGNDLQAGRNAIWALARVIDAISLLTDDVRGTSVNVGTIVGGTSPNTVAEHASCEVDLRCSEPQHADQLLAHIAEVCRRIGEGMEVKFTLEGGMGRAPLAPTAETMHLMQQYAAFAKSAGLGSDECALVGGGSDANTLASFGVPCIDGLGVRGKGFHTTNEVAEIASFAPKLQALLGFLRNAPLME